MEKNPMQLLLDFGQSPWLDNIRRSYMTSGELQRMIDEDGIVGMTANPTIFEKAISGSTDYDDAIAKLAAEGKDSSQIYKTIIVEDIASAADVLRQVYDRTEGHDGFVSIEVAPGLAHDTQGTVKEAVEFWEGLNRPNIMVKVPATEEGLPAIEELLYRGLNINITLIFSVDVHKRVMEAYLSALERRAKEGKPIDKIASVASFFVSRVDTKVDKSLDELLKKETDPKKQGLIKSLFGTAAINNSKMAYQEFLKVFGADRFQQLRSKGANVQRPLWASTSTKNPNYRDVLYVEELIGPDTVNTMPPQTVTAMKDHGHVARTIDKDLDLARQQLDDLEKLGISLKQVTDELTVEGVESFSKSFDTLDAEIRSKREKILAGSSERYGASLGGSQPQVSNRLRQINSTRFVSRLWEKDPTLWKSDDPEAQQRIKQRLGWLGAVHVMQERVEDLEQFADSVRQDGCANVVLLGMGGATLAPWVIYHVVGAKQGFPRLFMLDSTAPGSIAALERRIDPGKTLFIVSTKSGDTAETLSFYRYFRDKVNAVRGTQAGDSFVAITDPGSPLETLARDEGFRRTFLNMPDMGGRFSALSYFGLVPSALMGVDLRDLLGRAETMVEASASCVNAEDNPGVWLGAILGECYMSGRDKVTIQTSPTLDSFGMWVEQLIAASTNKEGKGLVPITQEPLGRPSAYGNDRVFIYLRLDDASDPAQEHALQKLENAGHPVVRLHFQDPLDIGAEFFRWQLAVSVAGSIIGINPFDEPNIKESKDHTKELLEIYEQRGKLPPVNDILTSDGLTLVGDQESLARSGFEGTLGSALWALFGTTHPGDYAAILAYIPTTGEQEALIQDARLAIRDRLRVATAFGYGPRFLHSTGQLYKGGPNKGVFIQMTVDPSKDLPIPGESYTFGTLIRAQADADLQSLQKYGRRAIRLHIRGDLSEGIEHAREAIRSALESFS